MPKINPDHAARHAAFDAEVATAVRRALGVLFDASGERKKRPRLGDLGHVLYSVIGATEDMTYALHSVTTEFVVQMLKLRGRVIVPQLGVFTVHMRRVAAKNLSAPAKAAAGAPVFVRVVRFRPYVGLKDAIKASDSPVATDKPKVNRRRA